MITFVRHVPIQRPAGATVEVFLGRQEIGGDRLAEITDPDGNTLNVAKIVDIYLKDDDRYATLKIIA